jgi:hypothetical protein
MNINTPFAHEPCAGIDKLIITTQDFRINDASKSGLTLRHWNTDLDTGNQEQPILFTDKAGKPIHGASAFINDEQYAININRNGLQVVFNPSKAYHPYKLCNDSKVLQERLETLAKGIKEKGFILDIEQAKISRIDLAKNANMEQPCIAYSPVFSWLNIKRAKRTAMYPDGYTSNNNRLGLIFYNKGKELRENKILVINDDKVMRCELQYKGTQSVCKRTGIGNIRSLIETGIQPLSDLYNETLLNDIFKNQESGQYPISYEGTKETLENLRRQYGQQALNYFYSIHGVSSIITEVGSLQAFESMLYEIGYHRNTVYKHKTRMMKLMKLQSNIIKKSHIGKLYKELTYKFAS